VHHVAIVVELRANIANYFDLKKVKGQGCKTDNNTRKQSCKFQPIFLKTNSLLYYEKMNCRLGPEETRLVGRITVFENKIKSERKAIGFAKSRYSKRLSAITYRLN
jgi:hypothetical protein